MGRMIGLFLISQKRGFLRCQCVIRQHHAGMSTHHPHLMPVMAAKTTTKATQIFFASS